MKVKKRTSKLSGKKRTQFQQKSSPWIVLILCFYEITLLSLLFE